MRKYSIIINHIGNDKYAVVLKSWLLDEDGLEIDVKSLVKSELSLEEAIYEQNKFIE